MSSCPENIEMTKRTLKNSFRMNFFFRRMPTPYNVIFHHANDIIFLYCIYRGFFLGGGLGYCLFFHWDKYSVGSGSSAATAAGRWIRIRHPSPRIRYPWGHFSCPQVRRSKKRNMITINQSLTFMVLFQTTTT